MASSVDDPFMCLSFAIRMSLSVKCLFVAFAHFLLGSFVHVTVEVCVGPLSDVWLLELFTLTSTREKLVNFTNPS